MRLKMKKDEFLCNLLSESFDSINIKEYTSVLKDRYFNSPSLWYERITPKSKALELMHITNGDYSEIWEEYCCCCFKEINKNTQDVCFVTKDKMTWLCKPCYETLIGGIKNN